MLRRKRKLICSNHERITTYAESILKIIEGEEGTKFNKIRDKLNEIIDTVDEAMISGQKMEDRLNLYKKTIEQLGFKRIKEKNK